MSHKFDSKPPTKPKLTIEEVNRILEVGRLLFSVLTDEEKEELIKMHCSSNGSDIGAE